MSRERVEVGRESRESSWSARFGGVGLGTRGDLLPHVILVAEA